MPSDAGEEGAIALLAAVMLVMLFSFAALSLDIGGKFLIKRNLQAAVDAAALAATYGLNSAPLATTTTFATNYLGYNGFPAANLASTPVVTTGRYCPTAATTPPTPSTRFTATTSSSATCPGDSSGTMFGLGTNAVQVTASATSPFFFGSLLVPGTTSEPVTATATATQINQAGILVGTGMVSLSSGVASSALSALFGNSINLDAVSYNGLLNTDINVVDFVNALASELGVSTGTYGSLLNSSVTLSQILNAAITTLGETNGITSGVANEAAALAGLETLYSSIGGNPTILLSQLLGLGTLENQTINAVNSSTVLNAGLNLYALATVSSQLAQTATALVLPVANLSIPGVATVSTSTTVLGAPTAPAFAFGPVGTVLNTAQARLQLTLSLLSGLSLLGASAPITLPVYLEQAGGTATITAIACGLSPATDATVTVSAQSGAAKVYIGTPSAATPITNLSTPVVVQPANLVTISVAVPLIGTIQVAVSGRAEVDVASGTATSLTFTQTQVTNGTAQTVSSTGITTNLLQTLLGSLVLTTSVTLGGVTTSLLPAADLSLITSTLSGLLTPVFAGLDTLVDNILAGLGIKLGYMNVTATGIRCGVPSLVL